MLGYFSAEWTFFSVLGLAGAFTLRHQATVVPAMEYGWAKAILLSAGCYAFLRLAGRTPLGITYGSHPAAKGHPVLSVVVAVIILAVLASRLV